MLQRTTTFATILGGAWALAGLAALAAPPAPSTDGSAGMPQARLFQADAGRVAWSHSTGLIAFDSITDAKTAATDIFTINPDGTHRRCVTCDSPLPAGFRGQMEWHPNGELLVLQAENAASEHRYFNHLAWGIDADLWVIRRDGTGAQMIWSPERPGGGALHARLSPDGKIIYFAERIPTGKKLPVGMRQYGPHGENQWDGWLLHIADFDASKSGPAMLSNHRRIAPSGGGFYEPGGFTPDGKLIYSHTTGGKAFCDDIFIVGIDGGNPVNVTRSPKTWDEHGTFSPNGQIFAFTSSRADPSLRFPRSKAKDLTTELFLQRGRNPPVQITRMNDGAAKRVVSRYAWSPDSRRIAFQVARLEAEAQPDLWILELP